MSSLPRTHESSRPMRQHCLSHSFIPPAHAPDSNPSPEETISSRGKFHISALPRDPFEKDINCLYSKCLMTAEKSLFTISFTAPGLENSNNTPLGSHFSTCLLSRQTGTVTFPGRHAHTHTHRGYREITSTSGVQKSPTSASN